MVKLGTFFLGMFFRLFEKPIAIGQNSGILQSRSKLTNLGCFSPKFRYFVDYNEPQIGRHDNEF